ncbi:teneurin-m-like [Ylistrum balloti]|uniref:teneurin-m-like n=1 Tax=Ylistrum balloti TaxID=509963 RepID=UPI00290590BE|nr:teneurin-m-like [Ylistrum balloti]
MDGNSNYRPKPQPRGSYRRSRIKDRGSKSYSSSEEEEFHSDDNLRPYEEVKVAHHDKKLNGLGLTPNEHDLTDEYHGNSHLSNGHLGNDKSRLYSYMSGSDGDFDDMDRPLRHASLNVHHQGSQCSISSNEVDNKNTRRTEAVSQLSLSDDSDQENINHSNLHHQLAATAPMLPPCLPNPPPPPPIEDIPQRTPVCVARQRSFGPSHRGNYSDAETCLCSRHYAESHIAALQHRGHYSDPDNPTRVRQCAYSEGESDFEPHYLEQTASGNVFIPDGHPRFPRTVPRSGSVPMSRSGEMVDPQTVWVPPGSNTVPAHFSNGDNQNMNHLDNRHAFTHSHFGCQQGAPPPGVVYPQHMSQDYYSKFSNTSHRMKEKLEKRCSWKWTAVILMVICVILLACAACFGAMLLFEEKEMVATENGHSALNSSTRVNPSFQNPLLFQVGDVKQTKIQPQSFWTMKFMQKEPKFIKFNFSIPGSAMLGFYARRHTPPTIAQFDFFEVFDGSKITPSSRNKRALSKDKRSYNGKDTALIHYMEEGNWYVAVFNDRNEPEYISFKTDVYDTLGTDCPNDCHGHGECFKGQCRCFPGYAGWDCSQTKCPVLCNGNGLYIRGTCRCHEGWKGPECEIPIHECEVPNCNGNGKCVNGQCVCLPGYKGPHCGLVDCLVPNCSGYGVCHLGNCVCHKGYKGSDCSLPDKLNISQVCARDCSGHGTYDLESDTCLCERFFAGPDCETEICRLECYHGHCMNQKCLCDEGWGGALCDQLSCDARCDGLRGICDNGTCICRKGWNGDHCTLDGCPNSCSNHGDCRLFSHGWMCSCHHGWKGEACAITMEMVCQDGDDNDRDGLSDCLDPDCCLDSACEDSNYCQMAPDPLDILLRKQPPSSTASFYEKMRFLIEENSVQIDTSRNGLSESQVSLIRGRVMTKDWTPLIGVRVHVARQPLYGYTLTRRRGQFDILVNGGGSVTLEFTRQPFQSHSTSVLVPWNQILTLNTVIMVQQMETNVPPEPVVCGVMHDYYNLQPVVLSTWQHTQLGACPEKSTIIPESQVVQESLVIPSTNVHLVYHSSDTPGYMSVILIQMTPSVIPPNLALVHLKVSVQGIDMEKTFEADPGLKYTFSWDRKNAFRQDVYGIVPARVQVGYQYSGCSFVYWEVRSTTMSGYDLASSQIGGWNIDIHHTYNFQEGILHKGDGTNIYLKEKPKKLVNILGNGHRRKLECDSCNGRARDNRLLAPVSLASGRDGSLYVWDLNYIRKVSPSRYDIASILKTSTISTSYKPYMTVSPVDGHLYVSDYMNHRVIKVATMGPVRILDSNYVIIAGNGEECIPGAIDRCGDGKRAINARLIHPKGIAISKEGVIYIADNLNIRMVTPDKTIHTLIGSQGQPRTWEPMSCEHSQPAEEIRLQWPTDLAIDPLDDSLHILDKNVILKLTKDGSLITVAGRPLNCPFRKSSFLPSGVLTDQEQASNIASDIKLVDPQSIAFGPQGEMYIVESDRHSINRVRVVTSDGRIHHFAGTKSKCDCQTITCKCYDSKETLAAQALFNELTSITVTPDGVVHIADAGNLRVFSVLSELPEADQNTRQYEVVSPETHEVYIFNSYGQHRHTVNIMTDQYVYNFTYNVNSFYGKLISIDDDVGNKIKITLDRETLAREIISPDTSRCDLEMNNIRKLHSFRANNWTASFTYSESTELLMSKYLSDGKAYSYSYDNRGRLLEVRQPTGEITTLATDVNTTGSIVRITTDNSDAVAMATYGSVQSVMHVMTESGNAETKVTYLPDGAVVVVFPSNLSISIESGGHPILANEYRMHFKRKVIAPNKLVHKLEWRYYLRRKGRTRQSKVIERIGHRMRVGAPFSSRHARMHDSHDGDEGSYKGKALLINGENLLTVEYDRETHTENIMGKNLVKIMSILYDGSGQPTHIRPNNRHHGMNITYSKEGRITHWQYGEIREDLIYDDDGLLREKSSSSGGAQYRFSYRVGKVPTDIILPNGLQYMMQYDSQGYLIRVRTPGLGEHFFTRVMSAGIQRFLYRVPELAFPYTEEYDGNGKLLQIIYPSERRRIIYRYNKFAQLNKIMFDETEINMEYDPQVSKVSASEVLSGPYDCRESYSYTASLVKDYTVEFARDRRLLGVKFSYTYDKNFRLKTINGHFRENLTSDSDMSYDEETGKLRTLKSLSMNWPLFDIEKISGNNVTFNREYDSYGRLSSVVYRFGEQEHFSLQIGYDLENRIHHWNCLIAQATTRNLQYVYDINGNVIDVLLNGQPTWRYGYDNNGNINKITEYGRTRNLEYDIGDRISKSGSKRFRFDKDGFMVQRHDQHVGFNSNGQLISVFKMGEYRYFYFYDAQGRLVIEEDGSGNVNQFYYGDVTQPQRVTHTFNQSSGDLTQYLYDSKGQLLALERQNTLYYIATDPMGTPLAVLNTHGLIVKQRRYDPLGQLESDTNPNFDVCFGFQGGLYNPMTQLVLFGKRVYDTENGHWISPDYSSLLRDLNKIPASPMITNNYQYHYPINIHTRQKKFPMLAITDWLLMLGYDLRSLAPDISYTGDIRPESHDASRRLLPMSSAFECTFLRDMDSLLTMTTVPKSKVSPLLGHFDLQPTPRPFMLGSKVTLSFVKGKAVIHMAKNTPKWAKQLAEVLVNGSEVVDLRYSIHGKDIHYFIKTDASRAEEDLRSLDIHSTFVQYENSMNITVNRIQHSERFRLSPHAEVDIRIHGVDSVINIRYGTTFERERQRILSHAKERAVLHAWEREKWVLQNGLTTQYRWSDMERQQILTSGYADGYEGHYIRSPEYFPELSDDCNNIRFTKSSR